MPWPSHHRGAIHASLESFHSHGSDPPNNGEAHSEGGVTLQCYIYGWAKKNLEKEVSHDALWESTVDGLQIALTL